MQLLWAPEFARPAQSSSGIVNGPFLPSKGFYSPSRCRARIHRLSGRFSQYTGFAAEQSKDFRTENDVRTTVYAVCTLGNSFWRRVTKAARARWRGSPKPPSVAGRALPVLKGPARSCVPRVRSHAWGSAGHVASQGARRCAARPRGLTLPHAGQSLQAASRHTIVGCGGRGIVHWAFLIFYRLPPAPLSRLESIRASRTPGDGGWEVMSGGERAAPVSSPERSQTTAPGVPWEARRRARAPRGGRLAVAAAQSRCRELFGRRQIAPGM